MSASRHAAARSSWPRPHWLLILCCLLFWSPAPAEAQSNFFTPADTDQPLPLTEIGKTLFTTPDTHLSAGGQAKAEAGAASASPQAGQTWWQAE